MGTWARFRGRREEPAGNEPCIEAGWRPVLPVVELCGGRIAEALAEIRRESGMPRAVASAYYDKPLWVLGEIIQELEMDVPGPGGGRAPVLQYCVRRCLAAMRAERAGAEKSRDQRTYLAYARALTDGVGGALAGGRLRVKWSGGRSGVWAGQWEQMREVGVVAYSQSEALELSPGVVDMALAGQLFRGPALGWLLDAGFGGEFETMVAPPARTPPGERAVGARDDEEGHGDEAESAEPPGPGRAAGSEPSKADLGREFIEWLEVEMGAGRLEPNVPGGLVYELDGALVLASPRAFRAFKPEDWKRVQQGLQKARRVRRNARGGAICQVTCRVGDGEQVIEGMVIEDWAESQGEHREPENSRSIG